MKQQLNHTLFFFTLFSVLILGCKKESIVIPSVTTTDVTNVTQNTAISGGNVTDDGGADITLKGVCWSTSPGPTVSDSKTSEHGVNNFGSSVTGLTAGTNYYLRAYATAQVLAMVILFPLQL
jgi:hypothetical protein